jgi:hypothetical protein
VERIDPFATRHPWSESNQLSGRIEAALALGTRAKSTPRAIARRSIAQ